MVRTDSQESLGSKRARSGLPSKPEKADQNLTSTGWQRSGVRFSGFMFEV